ncbi:Fur family transcriptional regulator [Streptomyces noursei]|uniref:Fur family transcriptional regulator n=1 Tax=Streptomyces noursei TaxID=1971 RepID=UPI00332A61C7
MARNRPQAAAPSQEVALIGRLTQQRATILEALVSADDFIGAQALHNQLAADDSPVGLTTVYRTLTALADAGRADVVRDTHGERLFRYRPGPDHRHYLLCTACGLSQPVDAEPVETWARKIARTSGFANVQHTLELSGVCPDCFERPTAAE